MERNGYSAVNSEKTIFMKRKGDEYIIHGLFVDDMMHIYSCDAMKDEFLALYKKDFDIITASTLAGCGWSVREKHTTADIY